MRPKIDINKIKQLPTTEDMFVDEYGAKGTAMRDEFDAKSRAWYSNEETLQAMRDAEEGKNLEKVEKAEDLMKLL
jgi:hypothetical protein